MGGRLHTYLTYTRYRRKALLVGEPRDPDTQNGTPAPLACIQLRRGPLLERGEGRLGIRVGGDLGAWGVWERRWASAGSNLLFLRWRGMWMEEVGRLQVCAMGDMYGCWPA